jgi:hypothetical protein
MKQSFPLPTRLSQIKLSKEIYKTYAKYSIPIFYIKIIKSQVNPTGYYRREIA